MPDFFRPGFGVMKYNPHHPAPDPSTVSNNYYSLRLDYRADEDEYAEYDSDGKVKPRNVVLPLPMIFNSSASITAEFVVEASPTFIRPPVMPLPADGDAPLADIDLLRTRTNISNTDDMAIPFSKDISLDKVMTDNVNAAMLVSFDAVNCGASLEDSLSAVAAAIATRYIPETKMVVMTREVAVVCLQTVGPIHLGMLEREKSMRRVVSRANRGETVTIAELDAIGYHDNYGGFTPESVQLCMNILYFILARVDEKYDAKNNLNKRIIRYNAACEMLEMDDMSYEDELSALRR